ncbi:MAG: hypothetical protein ACPLRM_05365, partial [Anaerolineae bacterium]
MKTPVYPPSNEYSFELLPLPENATEFRVITPEGYVYTFPVKRVGIVLDKSGVPSGFQWEHTNLYIFARVSLSECALRAFLPWWIKMFEEDPSKVIAGELVVRLVEEIAKASGAGPIPVGKLLDVAETIQCTKEGILYPLRSDEAYFIIGEEAHLRAEYMAGTYSTTWAWEGEGEWAGYVTQGTTQIRIPIYASEESLIEPVKSRLCLLFPNLGLCETLKCEQGMHNGVCYWDGFYVLNNQWGLEKRPDCVSTGSYQRISIGFDAILKGPKIEFNWANVKQDECGAQVKGYPAIIAGWHHGDPIPEYPDGYLTPRGVHGLPFQIRDRAQLNSGVHAQREGSGGSMNLSWDIWIAADPQPQKPKAEVMVWPW